MYQAPLPLVIGLDYTWDTKGSHGPVFFPQPGADSGNSFPHIKLLFYKCVIQPNITVIFGGTGRVVADFGKQAYEDDVLFFKKIKA